MMNFSLSGRHLIAGTAIDNADAVCTQTHGGSRRVHSHVSCAQNHDVFAQGNRGIHLWIQICLHEVGPCEIFIGGKDADQVFTRYVHEFGKTCAHSQIDSIVPFLKEFIQGYGSSYHLIAFQFGPEPLQKGYFRKNDFLGKPEFRNAVNQNAARFVKRFQNLDIMAFTNQIASHRKPRWP